MPRPLSRHGVPPIASERPSVEITFEMIMPFLIACPLVGLAGFVDAIAGGGGLISLPAYFMAGLPAHTAIATNKMSSTMGTALATVRFAQQGFVDWKRSLPCAALGLIGSVSGAHLALMVSDEALRWIMLAITPLVAFYVMKPKSMEEAESELSWRRMMVISLCISAAIGVYDGLYGPGTGTFLMIAFVSLAHYRLRTAAGTTKVVNLTTNIAALAVFLINGQVWLLLGIMAGLFNMVGAWLGVKLFADKGLRIVKPFMIGVLVLFFAKTLFEVL